MKKIRVFIAMVQCLVVDDDPRILNYIASHLQTEHIDAYTQPSGEAALKLLEKTACRYCSGRYYDGWYGRLSIM